METAITQRRTQMKENSGLEQSLTKAQGELERLQAELKDEEGDAADEVDELNSEV